MAMRRRFPCGAGVFALMACTSAPSSGDASADASTSTSTSMDSSGTEASGPTDGSSTDGGETTVDTDGCTGDCDVSIPECDLFAPACAEGEKCVPWGPLTYCVPVVPDAGARGDACMLTGPDDDCGAGLVCWPNAPGASEGTCEQLCGGEFQLPTCPDDADACAAYRRDEGWFPLCRPKCDPTLGACGPDSVCEQSSYRDWFVCAPAGLPTVGDPNAGCNLDADPEPLCAAGLHCDPGLLGCMEGCCYVLCDLSAPDTCDFGACLALADPAPGLDTLGVCKNG